MEVIHTIAGLGMGKLPNGAETSTPLHPTMVHWPIGLLTASYALDLLTLLPASIVEALPFLPPAKVVPALSFYACSAGLLTSLPVVFTGLCELHGMWMGQLESKGTAETVAKDAAAAKDLQGEKLKKTFTHASLMDAVLAVTTYTWWLRRKSPTFELSQSALLFSVASLPVMLFSAHLGGALVYDYAVGVQRQGSGKIIKAKQAKSS